jgi:hypothetical protein
LLDGARLDDKLEDNVSEVALVTRDDDTFDVSEELALVTISEQLATIEIFSSNNCDVRKVL